MSCSNDKLNAPFFIKVWSFGFINLCRRHGNFKLILIPLKTISFPIIRFNSTQDKHLFQYDIGVLVKLSFLYQNKTQVLVKWIIVLWLQEPLHQPNLTMFKITNLAQCHHSICIKLYSPHCSCTNPKALFNFTQILTHHTLFFHVTHLKISTYIFLANVCHLVTQKI